MHTIEAFHNYSFDIQIAVVLPETQIDDWNRLIASYNFTIRHQIAIGGKERFDSVKNGLQLVESETIRPYMMELDHLFQTTPLVVILS